LLNIVKTNKLANKQTIDIKYKQTNVIICYVFVVTPSVGKV